MKPDGRAAEYSQSKSEVEPSFDVDLLADVPVRHLEQSTVDPAPGIFVRGADVDSPYHRTHPPIGTPSNDLPLVLEDVDSKLEIREGIRHFKILLGIQDLGDGLSAVGVSRDAADGVATARSAWWRVAISEALVHDAPHLGAVRQLLDRRRHGLGRPPPLPLPLPDDPRVRDLHVPPHDLADYDRLHNGSRDDDEHDSKP